MAPNERASRTRDRLFAGRTSTLAATDPELVDRARLIDVLTQLLPFIGYPRTLNALRVVDETARRARTRGRRMTAAAITVVVVGATGSIGRLVVAEALRRGHQVRALVRSLEAARRLPPGAEPFVGDVTRPETLRRCRRRRRHRDHPRQRRPGQGRQGSGRLRRRPQRPRRPRSASGPHRADDLHRGDGAAGPLQPVYRGTRLEAARRTPRARQRTALHHRPSRMVRLQRREPAPPRAASGRPASRRRFQRRSRCPAADRRGAGAQPRSDRCCARASSSSPKPAPRRPISTRSSRRSTRTPTAGWTASATSRTSRSTKNPSASSPTSRPSGRDGRPRRTDSAHRNERTGP